MTASDPYMMDILRDGVSRFHRNLEKIDPTCYPPKYHALIRNQNSIGWDHVYRGRWAKEWMLLQHQHQSSLTTTEQTRSPSQWIIGLGRLMIDQWLQLWKLRNTQRHGHTLLAQSQLRGRILQSELQELYEYRQKVCPTDTHMFYASATEHLSQHPSLEAIESWIQSHRSAILASTEQAQRLGITGNRSLDEYLTLNPIDQTGD